MKNYKTLAPVIMIAIFVLGIYMVGSSNVKENAQYDKYLENARTYAEQKIEIYALENYQNALAQRPSLELYLEVAQFYRDIMKNRSKASEWGETMLALYPKQPEPYEFQLDLYLQNGDYISFFELYEDMAARKIPSAKADEMYAAVEYAYYESGDFDEASVFSFNLAPVRRNETWGYCNSRGKRQIESIYTYAGVFSNDMAPVIDAEGEAYFIDNSGNKIMSVNTEGSIQGLGVMSADIYSVFNGKEWNYYTKDGTRVMGGFSEAGTYANGLVAACKDAGWKIYDMNGNPKIETSYADVVIDEKQVAYRNERLFVSSGDDYWMIDGDGNRIGSETYEAARVFYDSTYAAVQKDGKWGFIDKEGTWFIEPVYDDARSFLNGYAAVQREGLWGYINMDKELCIPCQYTEAKDFTDRGSTLVKKNLTWTVLLLYKNNH